MATITHQFTPQDAIFPATNPGTLDLIAGTSFPVSCLDFDAATDETVYFRFIATAYGSGNVTVEVFWYADTATSGNVVWEVQLCVVTPDTDSQDVETDAFATLNYVQDAHLGTTGQRLHKATVTVTNLDSLAAGDWVNLRLARDANSSNATDDMSGDASVVAVAVSYSDT